jgi:hypothetical protein
MKIPDHSSRTEHGVAARAYDQPLGGSGAAYDFRTHGGPAGSHTDGSHGRWGEHRAVYRRAVNGSSMPSAARDVRGDLGRDHQLPGRVELSRGKLRVDAHPRASSQPYVSFPTSRAQEAEL